MAEKQLPEELDDDFDAKSAASIDSGVKGQKDLNDALRKTFTPEPSKTKQNAKPEAEKKKYSFEN